MRSSSQTIFAILLAFAMPCLSFGAEFDRTQFLSDPYVAFSNYVSTEDQIADFSEKFGDTQVILKDPNLERHAREMIDQVFEGFKKAYPQFMANKASPQVVIVSSEDSLDATAFTPRKHRQDHKGMMILTNSFLLAPFSRAAKLGVIAHEMAHLYLWHLDADALPIRVFYKSATISREANIAFQNWLILAQIIGWITLEESGGLTFDSETGEAVQPLIENIKTWQSPTCGEQAYNSILEIWQKITGHYSYYQWDFIFDSPQARSDLSHNSQAIIQKIQACLKTQDPSLNQIAINSYDRAIFSSAGVYTQIPQGHLTFDQYVQMTSSAQRKMREYAANFDPTQIRYYSGEDQADEVAVIVLRALGLSIKDFASQMISYLDAEKDQCLQTLAQNAEPPYGNLIDIHHATCWRAWNLLNLDKNLTSIPGLH